MGQIECIKIFILMKIEKVTINADRFLEIAEPRE